MKHFVGASILVLALAGSAVYPVTSATAPASAPAAEFMPAAAEVRVAEALVKAQPVIDLERHYAYIRDSQIPEGPIAFNPQHLLINPYFSNLAAWALLTDPANLPVVQRHMDWYIAHLNADGTIDDYERKSGQLRSTGTYDSADSYAATFFTIVARYLEAGGDIEWFHRNRADLDRIERMLISLTDTDGLTWAKKNYFLKYLMDNAEVYAGWLDWADALDRAGDPSAAAAARLRAAAVKEGLERFRQKDGQWAWGLDRLGLHRRSSTRKFYPDAVAQIFPVAWGLTEGTDDFDRFDEAQPLWRALGASDFPWTFPAYAAVRAGRADLLAEVALTIEQRYPNLEKPWFVTESAWVILAVHAKAKAAR